MSNEFPKEYESIQSELDDSCKITNSIILQSS